MGGAETQLLLLAKGLRDSYGVTPIFLFIGNSGKKELLPLLKAEDIQYFQIATPKRRMDLFVHLLYLIKLMWVCRIDGVISFLDTPSMLTCIAHKFVPRVKFHIWGIRSSILAFKMNRWYELAFKLSDYFISNSQEGLEVYLRLHSFKNQTKFKVISNGVVLPNILTFKKSDSRSLKICMVANYRPSKRFDILLESFRQVNSKINMQLELKIVGRDTHLLDSQCDEVTILGYVNNIREILATVDIGILMTDYEGQPNVILEYMAFGLPIIASDIPEIRAVLPTESCEFLVSNDHVEGLTEKLSELILKPDFRKHFGKRNFDHCVDHYDVNIMVDKYWGLISERLNSNIRP